MRDLPQDLRKALIRLDLLAADTSAAAEPLTGGVSSDIWRVDLPDGPICIKRALAKLKVDADWQVPVERNKYEISWLEIVAEIAPGAAPRLLGRCDDDGLFAMEYLDPAAFPLWKSELMAGRADLVCLARPHLADPYWTLRAGSQIGDRQASWPKPYEPMWRSVT